MRIVLLASVIALSFLNACQTTEKAEHFSKLGVKTSWDGVKTCTGGLHYYYKSPKFEITGIPKDTKYLEFNLYHVDAGIDHGTDKIAYGGGTDIPAGQFEYLGPCPQGSGIYEWSVTALDKTQKLALGEGTLTLSFPAGTQGSSGAFFLKREPGSGELSFEERVLVDDGSCPTGQIKQVTGGSRKRNIGRQRQCVARPD